MAKVEGERRKREKKKETVEGRLIDLSTSRFLTPPFVAFSIFLDLLFDDFEFP